MAAPNRSVCTPWATTDDICTAPCSDYDFDVALLTDTIDIASDVLFELSGRQFPGICTTLVYPCSQSRPSDPFPDRDSRTASLSLTPACPCGIPDRCGCGGLSQVELGVVPVTAINEVRVDGAILPATSYRIDDYRYLVRTDDESWPCFPAGTLVLTDSGLKNIETIQPGERVLTHRNRWRTVLRSGKTGDSETVGLRGRGGRVNCTPDHRFWASQVYGIPGKRKLGSPEWREAESLIGWAWATPQSVPSLPIPFPSETTPEEFWWIVGRWLADGYTDQNRIVITVGHHKEKELQAALDKAGIPWSRSVERTASKYRWSDKVFARWLNEHFGKYAHGKRLPAWLLGASENVKIQFLNGYRSGDGNTSFTKRGGKPVGKEVHSVRTVSEELAYGVFLLLATLGYAPRVNEGIQRTDRIEGRRVAVRSRTFSVLWSDMKPDEKFSRAWADGEHLWGRVYSSTLSEEVVPVYDLEVEEDHSFVVNGFVVHNCCSDHSDPALAFSVDFDYGFAPPPAGVRAAADLACQLALSCDPATVGECKLPQRVTSITRQGVSMVVLDPFDFLEEGRTGVYTVDLFLKTYNPTRNRRPPAVWSPDIGRRTRRIDT